MARKLSTEKPEKVRKSNVDPGNKPIIAAGIGIAVVFLLFLVGMGILLVSFLGRFAEDDTATGQVTTFTYSIKQRSDFQNGYAGRTFAGNVGNAYELYGEEGAAEMEGETTLPKVTSNYGSGSEFEYGTIKGSTYKSEFSGITFDAPSGWTLRGASKSTVTPTSILDLDARNSTSTQSEPASVQILPACSLSATVLSYRISFPGYSSGESASGTAFRTSSIRCRIFSGSAL